MKVISYIVACCLSGAACAQTVISPLPVTASYHAVKVSVTDDETLVPTGRTLAGREGTAFSLYKRKNGPNNYTLFFLTAAHVIVGVDEIESGSDPKKFNRVLTLHFDNDTRWILPLNDTRINIAICSQWRSRFNDVAIFSIDNISSQLAQRFSESVMNTCDYGTSEPQAISIMGYRQGQYERVSFSGSTETTILKPYRKIISFQQGPSPGVSGAPVMNTCNNQVVGIYAGEISELPGMFYYVDFTSLARTEFIERFIDHGPYRLRVVNANSCN